MGPSQPESNAAQRAKPGRKPRSQGEEPTSLLLSPEHRAIAQRAAGHDLRGNIAQGIRVALDEWAKRHKAQPRKTT